MWNEVWLWIIDKFHWILGGSLAMFFGGIALVFGMVAILPSDHFLEKKALKRSDEGFALYILGIIVRNVIGLLLVILGCIMVVGPGPGWITVLLGLSLMDIPGRHRAVSWILSRRSIRRSLNWLRRKANRPPLRFP